VDICIQNLKYKSQNSRKDSQYLMFLKDWTLCTVKVHKL
jgi:hypothetical protein